LQIFEKISVRGGLRISSWHNSGPATSFLYDNNGTAIDTIYHKKNENDIETVYDMKNVFNGDIDNVTIEMLDSVEHTPAVIVRPVL